MENQKSNSNLKAVIAILALLLVGSLVYIFKMTSDAKALQTELTTTKTDKESVMKDLEELKATYDAAIAENTSMSEELIAEREKVANLISDLKKSKGDVASMAKYKSQYFALETKMKGLMQEVEVLKKENATLTTQRDSTVMVLGEAKKYNEVLVGQNEELTKTVEIASKLTVSNLKTAAYKMRSSGKQIETEKARRADILKISFTIAENKVAKTGDKTYYVQVIDSKNNVLGEKKTETFADKSLTYSFSTVVQYENQSVNVTQDLPGKDFERYLFCKCF
jgi:uncharacterized protein (DUF3084 family)